MTQFFARKLNKKGFTLAELLIVIAIIAILIAIAFPIFTNALESARIAVHQSNARAIKSMAITELLAPSSTDSRTNAAKWLMVLETAEAIYAKGTVADGGKITFVSLEKTDPSSKIANDFAAVSNNSDYKDSAEAVSDAGKIDIHSTCYYSVKIEKSEVTALSAPSGT